MREAVVGEMSLSFCPARHPVETYAVAVTCDGARFVYTGDTNTDSAVELFCSGADLLLADAGLSTADYAQEAPHLSAALCGKLARDAGVKRPAADALQSKVRHRRLARGSAGLLPRGGNRRLRRNALRLSHAGAGELSPASMERAAIGGVRGLLLWAGVRIVGRREIAPAAWLACAAALARDLRRRLAQSRPPLVSPRDGRGRAAGRRADDAALDCTYKTRRFPSGFSIEFEGAVVSEPALNADGDRIVCALRVDEMDGEPADCTVRLYLRSEILPLEGIEYGQRLSCFGHIWPQDAASNPYEFDAQEWLLSDGMTGMAAAKLEDVRVTAFDPGLGGWAISVRGAISERIGALFPHNAELVRAFVLGDRTGMDSDLTERFSQTGITHLICISGMHISVLAAVVSALLNRIVSRRASVAITLAVIVGYGFLIGFPASLIRATVMFASFSLAPVFGRPSDPITRLCTALLAMLAFNPLFVLDGGFALSFQASAGILLLDPPLERLFGVDRLRQIKPRAGRMANLALRAAKYFPQLLCSTLAAQLNTRSSVSLSFPPPPLLLLREIH